MQLAKRAGLRVIGTTSKAEGAALLRALGVDLIIDYATQHVGREVRAFTDGRGVDLVWDSTYKRGSLVQSAGLVARGGVWCMLSTAEQVRRVGVMDYDALLERAAAGGARATFSDYWRWLAPGPLRQSRPHLMQELLNAGTECWKEGTVRPRVTLEVPFEAAALQRVLDEMREGRSSVGKAVVKVET